MVIYVVTWSRAIGGDEIPTDCFCGCVGTFTSLSRAKDCMRQDVDSTILDIKDGFEEQDDPKDQHGRKEQTYEQPPMGIGKAARRQKKQKCYK